MSIQEHGVPERILPALTRRAFMGCAALTAAGMAALALVGCAPRQGDGAKDGGAFFDDGTGFTG